MESKYIPDNLHEWSALYKLCKRISMACAPFTFHFISISGYLDHNLIHHAHSPWVEDSGGRNIYSSVSQTSVTSPRRPWNLLMYASNYYDMSFLSHQQLADSTGSISGVSPVCPVLTLTQSWWIGCPSNSVPINQCSPSPSCAPHQNGEKLFSQLCSGTKIPIPCHLCPSITLLVQ